MNTENRRNILKSYYPIADMIYLTMGSKCEVVIHDLQDVTSSLIYIRGTVTGREIGAPTTEVLLKELRRYGNSIKDINGGMTQTSDGRLLRTSTSFIRDYEGTVIGFIGINFDVTAFQSMKQLINEFSIVSNVEQSEETTVESYAKNVEEVLWKMIDNTFEEMNVSKENMIKEDKVKFVRILDDKGIFLIKGSVDRIANMLKVSKQTVYNYLDQEESSF